MGIRKPDLGSMRNLSGKTIAKMAAWPIAAFAATYLFCSAANLPRKLETSLFVAAVFLILGIKHTRKEKREPKSQAPKKNEGESFFTKPWPPPKQ